MIYESVFTGLLLGLVAGMAGLSISLIIKFFKTISS